MTFWFKNALPALAVILLVGTLALTAPANAAPAAALTAPRLVSPANGATITSQPFVFNWDPVSGADRDNLQIATNSAFSPILLNIRPYSDGWASQTPFAAAKLFWRVRAQSGTATVGPWSEVRTVIVSTSGSATPTPAPTPASAPTSGQPWNHPLAFTVPYAASSYWNTPISGSPGYDPNSTKMVETLGLARNSGAIGSDPTQYTYPVYWADSSTPRHEVSCGMYRCTIIGDNGEFSHTSATMTVPIPSGAKPSGGTDGQMIVVDVETGTEYGLYHARQVDGKWYADGGYKYSWYASGTPQRMGARGAGIAYSAGLIRPWEIRAGAINHALAFAYEFPSARGCVYPATKFDGRSTLPYAIPEGARLQLNPNLTNADFDRMGLSATGRIVARALQQYGMILVDTGGSTKIMAENVSVNTTYPVDSWDSLGFTRDVIATIPYQEFRVLDLPDGYWNGASPNFGKCIR